MTQQNYLLDILDSLLDEDIPQFVLPDVINAHYKFLAGLSVDDVWE